MPERQTRDSIRDVYGPRTPYYGEGQWPVRVDQRALEEPERWVQSCCVLCSTGCGMDIGVKGGRIVGVRGRAVDRVNRGRLGPKGLHGWIANGSRDRLTRPLVRDGGKLREATWDEAMGLIVARSKDLIRKYGGNAIGFHGTGQAFLEEYYTIAMITKAGIRTPHKDGNTRLCTATCEWALQESFGSDGQPASYNDLDVADTILLAGYNMASQNTVLWMRLLDRIQGPNPPRLVVIDPRTTETARRATVHLAPRVGTNVAVMNGLLNLIIGSGRVDADFLANHTVGFDELKAIVAKYTPEHVEQITRIPARQLAAAADVLGTAQRLVSMVLQGFYQSQQATAASVQVNNLNLIRGMIGKPGCGVFQMNGQPTSENTRECGADGSYPVFFNFENPRHMAALARHWNVEPSILPTYQPPTHIMQIMRYCEVGSIKMLWIIATNPAISLPESARIRRILSKEDLFVVAQDAFMTETTELADVVLPAAIWGEKTGTFTNADRTVHISHKAIDPPGEARSDFHILVDYARRMDFRDKDGQPLVKYNEPEGAFNHYKELTRGRLCDYSGMSYARLTGGSGIQWPCNEQFPNGCDRLYADHKFNTSFEECETFGHDLKSGAEIPKETYKAEDPKGRAILRGAEYVPPHEEPDQDYPLWLTTGRLVYHFHTRTKTARSPELNAAAPDSFVELNAADAKKYGIAEGDMVEVESRRGRIAAPARIVEILEGHAFVPFHYGYWDHPGRHRHANELTMTMWDPISKQPYFKYAAVRIKKVAAGAAATVPPAAELVKGAAAAVEGAVVAARSGPHAGHYLALLHEAERQLGEALTTLASHHSREPEVREACKKFAGWSTAHAAALEPLLLRFPKEVDDQPKRVRAAMFQGPRVGSLGLMRDIHDVWLLAQDAQIAWLALGQFAKARVDEDLKAVCDRCGDETARVVAWCYTQFKVHIVQALVMG